MFATLISLAGREAALIPWASAGTEPICFEVGPGVLLVEDTLDVDRMVREMSLV